MGLKWQASVSPAPASRGLQGLEREISDNLPILVRVEIRHRSGIKNGRTFKVATFMVEIDSEEERDTEKIYSSILEGCESLEEQHGSCFFRADIVVCPPNEAVQTIRQIPFRLEDSDEVSDSVSAEIVALTRFTSFQDKLLVRSLQRLEGLLDSNIKLGTTLASMGAANAELRRVEYEHADRMAQRAAEAERAEQEFDLLKDLGPKWLMVQAAKDARRETTAQGGPKISAWRRLIGVCKAIVVREPVRACLGEHGVDLLEAVAAATKKEEVLDAWRGFQAKCEAGEINIWKLLTLAPELAAFADMAG